MVATVQHCCYQLVMMYSFDSLRRCGTCTRVEVPHRETVLISDSDDEAKAPDLNLHSLLYHALVRQMDLCIWGRYL